MSSIRRSVFARLETLFVGLKCDFGSLKGSKLSSETTSGDFLKLRVNMSPLKLL